MPTMNPLPRCLQSSTSLSSWPSATKYQESKSHHHNPCQKSVPIKQEPRLTVCDEEQKRSIFSTQSRRGVITQFPSIALFASLLPYVASPPFRSQSEAAELPQERDCSEPADITQKAYLEVSIDGKPAGRIVIGLFGRGAPVGTERFVELVTGKAGVSYRRKEFVRIMPNYVQNAGVRSYGVDSELAKRSKGPLGLVADDLVVEWADRYGEDTRDGCGGFGGGGGAVGIIVRDPHKPPPKLKVVARKGRIEIDEEEEREDPNGTEFVITTKAASELDSSVLIVGRVLAGMDVVDAISRVPTVQENTSSPYFRVAKLIGDKRAVVAERGFNRPYSKIVITKCGLLD